MRSFTVPCASDQAVSPPCRRHLVRFRCRLPNDVHEITEHFPFVCIVKMARDTTTRAIHLIGTIIEKDLFHFAANDVASCLVEMCCDGQQFVGDSLSAKPFIEQSRSIALDPFTHDRIAVDD